jgi:hypothetical protein
MTFLIHSVFSATLLLSITALFREPKAREDLQLDRVAIERQCFASVARDCEYR